MSTEIIEQSGFYRLWIEQGREQGIEQGIEQGVHEALVAALRGRFGEPGSDIEEAAAAVSREAALRLLSTIATVSLADVRRQLGLAEA